MLTDCFQTFVVNVDEIAEKPKDKRGKKEVYPWSKTEVGSGFEIPEGKLSSVRCGVYGQKDKGRQFEIVQLKDGRMICRRIA